MFLRQTLLYLPAQVFGLGAQVVAAIVWTHWLDPAPYGLVTFLIASQDLVFVLCLFWWTHYTMRYLGALQGESREAFLLSETPVFVLTFAAQIVATLLLLAFLREPFTANLAFASIACVGTRSLLTHLGERARVQSHIDIYTVGQICGSVVGFAWAYSAVVAFSATPAAILWGYALAQLLGVVLMWWSLKIARGSLLPDAATLKAAFAYGAPLLVAGILAWTAQNGIRVVVDKTAGAEALGLIAVGWGLGQRLAATLAMLVVAASFPLAVKHWRGDAREDAYRHLGNGGVLLVGLILPASIGLCLLAEPFVTLFVAAPFREMTIAVLPYAAAAGAVRNIRMHVADPVFLLMERPRVNTALNFCDAATMIVGCFAGFYIGGLIGAVVGCLVATLATAFGGFILAYRIGAFSFPYGDGLRILAASAVMGIVLATIPWASLGVTPMARLAVEATLGASVYAIAIAIFYPAIVTQFARRWLAPA